VIVSLSPVNVDNTSVFVNELGLYDTDAVGFVMSILSHHELANTVQFHNESSAYRQIYFVLFISVFSVNGAV
jgi:hypothetical protein